MDDGFLVGEIRLFAHDRVPPGWMVCVGQSLSIKTYTQLYDVIGTTYGGDGVRAFQLPDLGGSAPVGQGQGPGQRRYTLGQTGGSTSVALQTSEMPVHRHALMAATQDPATAKLINPDATWSLSQGGGIYQTSGDSWLAHQAMMPAGDGRPHNNMQPYLVLTFCIAAGAPSTAASETAQ